MARNRRTSASFEFVYAKKKKAPTPPPTFVEQCRVTFIACAFICGIGITASVGGYLNTVITVGLVASSAIALFAAYEISRGKSVEPPAAEAAIWIGAALGAMFIGACIGDVISAINRPIYQ